MNVCLYVCTYVFMYVDIYIRMCLRMHARTYVCTYVRRCACTCAWAHIIYMVVAMNMELSRADASSLKRLQPAVGTLRQRPALK